MFLKNRKILIIFGIILLLLAISMILRRKDNSSAVDATPVQETSIPETKVEVLPAKSPAPEVQSDKEVSPQATEVAEPEEVKRARTLAKLTLSSMYTAQRAYHVEFGRYTTDLKMAGWIPSEKELSYKAGFTKAYWADPETEFEIDEEDPRFLDSDAFVGFSVPAENPGEVASFYSVNDKLKNIRLGDFSHLCKNGCTAGPDRFELLLVMVLQDDKHVDVWSINEKKELTLVQDGFKNPTP